MLSTGDKNRPSRQALSGGLRILTRPGPLALYSAVFSLSALIFTASRREILPEKRQLRAAERASARLRPKASSPAMTGRFYR